MTKGNQLQLFYIDSSYKTFAHSTANGLSYSVETQTVSSKDIGRNPLTESTGSSWSFTGTCLFTVTTANVALGMAKSGEAYTFAFAQINENWAPGLSSVNVDSSTAAWTPGSAFIQYGNGIVTDFSITANDGENATCDLTITGSGPLSDSAPSTVKSWGSNNTPAQTEE